LKKSERLELIFTDPRQAVFRAFRSDLYNSVEDIFLRSVQSRRTAVVNANELRVLGMRRSGNHAVIEWLMKSFGGPGFHLNNVPPGQNAYRHRDQYPEPHDSERYTERMRMARFGRFEPLNVLVRSYEDFEPGDVFREASEPLHDLYYGKTGKFRDVLILRDPFNLFASRMKSGKVATKPGIEQIELWLRHARFAVESAGHDNFVLIKFDDWARSIEYRHALQKRFSLEPKEISTEKVSTFGGGSSFDGTAMDGKASGMAVLDRWKSLRDDPAFAAVLDNAELRDYRERIFGPTLQ
jgi:hypothetical protein